MWLGCVARKGGEVVWALQYRSAGTRHRQAAHLRRASPRGAPGVARQSSDADSPPSTSNPAPMLSSNQLCDFEHGNTACRAVGCLLIAPQSAAVLWRLDACPRSSVPDLFIFCCPATHRIAPVNACTRRPPQGFSF